MLLNTTDPISLNRGKMSVEIMVNQEGWAAVPSSPELERHSGVSLVEVERHTSPKLRRSSAVSGPIVA